MNIIDTIAQTITDFVMPRNNTVYQQQPRQNNQAQIQYNAPQPPLTPSMELANMNREMGLPIVNFTDAEASLYLGKTRQYLQEFRTKQGVSATSQQKYNQAHAEMQNKDAMREQSNQQSYQDRENFRINNANQQMQKHNAENMPYLSYIDKLQQQIEQQIKSAPMPPIHFG